LFFDPEPAKAIYKKPLTRVGGFFDAARAITAIQKSSGNISSFPKIMHNFRDIFPEKVLKRSNLRNILPEYGRCISWSLDHEIQFISRITSSIDTSLPIQ